MPRNLWTHARTRMLRSLLSGLLLLTASALLFAQGTTGTIAGTVTDQSGAAIPGAAVAVRNLETGATRDTVTDEAGRFNVPGLPVGSYEISVELAGFSKFRRGPINL